MENNNFSEENDKDFLNDIITGEQKPKNDKSNLDVLNELFSGKEIRTRTELSCDQIILINQKRIIAKMLDWKELDNTLNDFMMLQVSLMRKGRAEFVEGFKAEREHEKQASGGFMNSIKDKLGFK